MLHTRKMVAVIFAEGGNLPLACVGAVSDRPRAIDNRPLTKGQRKATMVMGKF